VLSQYQAVLPFTIRSLSLIIPGTASRKCRGSAYQIRTVCEPVSSDAIELGLSVPGRLGRPSDALSTTVPVSAGSGPVRAPTAASSCAGVRAGRAGLAWAVLMSAPAMTAPTAASTPAGTAHRARGENFTTYHLLSG
jgi:hypothetical protein